MGTIEGPAGPGWRIGARIVDTIVFTWIAVFLLVEIDQRLLGGDPFGQRQARLSLDSTRAVVLLLALVVLYEVVPSVMYGATPGKALLGLRIRMVTPDVPVALAAVGRAAVIYLPVIFLGTAGSVLWFVLLISIVIARNGRGLHDRLLGTLVISVAREKE